MSLIPGAAHMPEQDSRHSPVQGTQHYNRVDDCWSTARCVSITVKDVQAPEQKVTMSER